MHGGLERLQTEAASSWGLPLPRLPDDARAEPSPRQGHDAAPFPGR